MAEPEADIKAGHLHSTDEVTKYGPGLDKGVKPVSWEARATKDLKKMNLRSALDKYVSVSPKYWEEPLCSRALGFP